MSRSNFAHPGRFQSVPEFVKFITDDLKETFRCENAFLYLYDKDLNLLEKAGVENFIKTEDKHSIEVDESTFPGWCALYNEEVFSNDLSTGKRTSGLPDEDKIKNLAVIPINTYGKLEGVLVLFNKSEDFDRESVSDLKSNADDIPLSLSYVKMREDLENLEIHFGDMITRNTDFLTPESEGHVLRVAGLCSQMAIVLDISDTIRQKIWKAAIFHDVGKILMLGREPWEIERFHTREGAAYLRSINVLTDIAYIVETSHERYDGTGVPSALGGDVIPVEAWILALAEDIEEFNHQHKTDFFEDMLLNFYKKNAPGHHPAVVEALSVLVDSGNLEKILRGSGR